MRVRRWILAALAVPLGLPGVGFRLTMHRPSRASSTFTRTQRQRRRCFSQAEIDMMTKHTPACFIGLK